MGRTSKYKKIKAFDPYSKQNNGKQLDFIWGFGDNGAKPKKRSRTAEKLHQQKLQRRMKRVKGEAKKPLVADRSLNRPPSDDEDEFELNNLNKLTTQKDESQGLLLDDNDNQQTQLQTVTPTTGTTKMDPTKSIREAEKLLKLDAKTSSAVASSQFQGRQEHESKNAFNKRVKAETRQIIKSQKLTERNPEKKKRKKEFLNAKKKKKKGGKTHHDTNDNDSDDDDDGYRRPANVPFGDQVERPPVFQSLPRGSKRKHNNSDNGDNKSKKSIQTQHDIQAEQANLEKMRLQVQAQYAAIKAKRKRGGDFHL